MNIKFNSIGFDADKKLLDFIETRLNKLTQFSSDIIGAEVFMKFDKAQTPTNKTVKIKLEIPGYDLFAERQAAKFEEAADEVIAAIRRQLKKRKEKRKSA